MITLALIILPLAGVALWVPFTNADTNGYVNYRSTETLYFNEFWYEYEYIEAGQQITYSVQSAYSDITFAIWNQPFEYLPKITKDIDVINSVTIDPISFDFWTEWLFLRAGSSIEYEFNSSANLEFFIADGFDFYTWNQGGSPIFPVHNVSTNTLNGTYNIGSTNDYYIVWYNEFGPSIDVDYVVNYTATNVPDFSGTYETQEGVTSHAGTFSPIPSPGNWYFFIYFDPMISPDESTTITFDVTYDTGVTYLDRWIDIRWILIIILVVVVIIIIAAVVARRGQKKLKLKAPTTPEQKKVSPYKVTPPETVEKEIKCTRCDSP